MVEAVKSKTPELLAKEEKQVLKQWIKNQLAETTLSLDLIDEEDLEKGSREFLHLFVQAISTGNLKNIEAPEYEPVIRMLKNLSKDYAYRGFTPPEAAIYVFSLKYVLMDLLEKEYGNQPEIYNQEVKDVSRLLDQLGILAFETYTKVREELAQEQAVMMTEIETPISQIWRNILLLPIIGTVDSRRAQTMMDKMLQKILDTESKVIILDIAGVPAVDTAVANHILKINKATRLMGCTCIISGIAPAVAQSIVNLGVDVGDLVTKATLKDALEYAFGILNVELTEKR
nr:STAS domain-containing protein [Desulfobacterales bacterium]